MSNVVRCSQAAAVLQGQTAGMLAGLVCGLDSMDGVSGTLVVALRSASVWGSSLELVSSSGVLVSVVRSVSESEQGSVASVATDVSSSSWVIDGVGAFDCLLLVDLFARG